MRNNGHTASMSRSGGSPQVCKGQVSDRSIFDHYSVLPFKARQRLISRGGIHNANPFESTV